MNEENQANERTWRMANKRTVNCYLYWLCKEKMLCGLRLLLTLLLYVRAMHIRDCLTQKWNWRNLTTCISLPVRPLCSLYRISVKRIIIIIIFQLICWSKVAYLVIMHSGLFQSGGVFFSASPLKELFFRKMSVLREMLTFLEIFEREGRDEWKCILRKKRPFSRICAFENCIFEFARYK